MLIAALACFSLSDVSAKFLNRTLPPIEIAWLRYTMYSLLMVPPLLRSGRSALVTRRPGLQILRGFGMLGSALFFILAIRTLPLAAATATAFVSPVFVTALSIPVLGERVGVRRWGAVAVGLAGVLIIVRPGAGSFNPGSFWPLLSASGWAVAVVITRLMAGADRPLTTLIWSACCGLLVLSALLPFVWVQPTGTALLVGMFMGTANTTAQLLVTLAYREADASLLAPFAYTQLIWATALGLLVFGAVPDLWTLVGAAVIIASGLYTAHRQRLVSRQQTMAGAGESSGTSAVAA